MVAIYFYRKQFLLCILYYLTVYIILLISIQGHLSTYVYLYIFLIQHGFNV